MRVPLYQSAIQVATRATMRLCGLGVDALVVWELRFQGFTLRFEGLGGVIIAVGILGLWVKSNLSPIPRIWDSNLDLTAASQKDAGLRIRHTTSLSP